MDRIFLRIALTGAGLVSLALAIGFGSQLPWAIALWPLPDGRLSFIFMAAILAGAAMPLLWIAWSGSLGALRGYTLGFSVMYGGMAVTALQVYAGNEQVLLLMYGLLVAVLAALCIMLFMWNPASAQPDVRPMPSALRIPFAIEVVVLALVGIALVMKMPNVLPWSLRPESSVMYGWVFLGLALYFGYTLVKRTWAHTQGQLLGFLAYDFVLLLPLLRHFTGVKPEHRPGLFVATLIIMSSGALAVYELFMNKDTRVWGAATIQHVEQPSLC